MTAIEIIALIIVAVSAIKLVVLMVSPQAWYGHDNPLVKLWSGTAMAMVSSLVLGVVVLYYLLQEMTIVQVFAVMAFLWAVMGLVLAPYVGRLFAWARSTVADPNFWSKNWFPALVWVALMAWVVWEIFV